ncbi:hypothetical protein M011DRAFT_465723 [Sporormia fimetaria CBS 119925]|uniref:Invertebrate defensins family profile domain-containing protein n=1 Tax=Sporormia fimetaria CBS 119925 TaxID=1340428 RepID=A0A6A6VHJ6_9PLEO|nr:hypothetical protein M011DRAFT_465723 [Sporormia fimetaria CBS 119925]
MRIQLLIPGLLLTLISATPLPNPPTDHETPNLETSLLQEPQTKAVILSPDGNMATLGPDMAVKNWQAAGGCKRDWDENRRCLNQCIGEANTRCVGWKSMTGVIQGGCFPGWNTCRCVCEY